MSNMTRSNNLVPGSETLGWGFNIFGPYADSSRTSLLFQVKPGDQTWKDPSTDVEYDVPNNVSSPAGATDPSEVEYRVFDGRSEVQQYFSSKAKVELGLVAEFGAFSGSFNAAFSAEVNSSREFKYGIVAANHLLWQMGLETEDLNQLTESVQADISSLPTTYSKGERRLFFAFFDKYGTHYIASVTMGGRLYYNVAIEKSYASIADDRKIEVEMKYEYLGLFSASANAQAEWKNVTKDWMDSRRTQIRVIGGASAALAAVNPAYGENDGNVYQAWAKSVGKEPAVVDFILRPIATLFPITQQDSIQKAYNDYLAIDIVDIKTKSVPYSQVLPSPGESVPDVQLGGKRILPDYDPKYSIGFLIVVMKPLNAALTEVVFLNYYSIDLWGNDQNYTALFDEMARQTEAATHELRDYVLTVVSFNWNYFAPPSNAFAGVLRSAGAGGVLDEWLRGSQYAAGSIGPGYDCNYCLVGKGGTSRTAAEAMDVSTIFGRPAEPVSTRLRARIDERGDVLQLNA